VKWRDFVDPRTRHLIGMMQFKRYFSTRTICSRNKIKRPLTILRACDVSLRPRALKPLCRRGRAQLRNWTCTNSWIEQQLPSQPSQPIDDDTFAEEDPHWRMSLLATAKANGLEPMAYLTDVLTKLPTTLNKDIDRLLPIADLRV
jgi:hypothetical protein